MSVELTRANEFLLQVHPELVSAMAFQQGHIVVGTAYPELIAVDATRGEITKRAEADDLASTVTLFSGARRCLVTLGDGSCFVVHAQGLETQHILPEHPQTPECQSGAPSAVVIKDRWAVTGGYNGEVLVTDLTSGRVTRRPNLGLGPILRVQSAGDDTVSFLTYNGEVATAGVTGKGNEAQSLYRNCVGGWPGLIASNGSRVVRTADRSHRTMHAWEPGKTTRRVTARPVTLGGDLQSLVELGPSYFAALDRAGLIHALDYERCEVRATFRLPAGVLHAAASFETSQLAVLTADGQMHIRDYQLS